jgi:Uncharacterised nucleotidyltransferase
VPDHDLRAGALAALRPRPDFSGLHILRRCGGSRRERFLRWLDQSGIALYLLNQLQEHEGLDHVPELFHGALERRLEANRRRTLSMFSEFSRIVASFEGNGVRFCVVKGFALTPDFCCAAHLRHQTDFDFLIAPESMDAAKRALRECGYAPQVEHDGEVTFATPLRHIPSPRDDIYEVPRHREVDLLTRIQHVNHGISLDIPTMSLDQLKKKTLMGTAFPCLPFEDMFLVQVIHAFTHLMGSWVRLSWLVEIGHFIDGHHDDEQLWRAVIDRVGRDPKTRSAVGLILSLVTTLFPRPIPHLLADGCLRALPARIQAWVAQFGVKAAISDLDGTKLTLFVHRGFVDDQNLWNSYVWNRFFPVGRHSTIGSVATIGARARIRVRASQWVHSLHRSMFHARELIWLPVEWIRWKFALRSVEKQRMLVSRVLTR